MSVLYNIYLYTHNTNIHTYSQILQNVSNKPVQVSIGTRAFILLLLLLLLCFTSFNSFGAVPCADELVAKTLYYLGFGINFFTCGEEQASRRKIRE